MSLESPSGHNAVHSAKSTAEGQGDENFDAVRTESPVKGGDLD
jgi:hypothetical protein